MDNKLTQQEWHFFCNKIYNAIKEHRATIHFFGGSSFNDPWQNACIVFNALFNLKELKEEISNIGKQYNQESIAWTEGTTQFI